MKHLRIALKTTMVLLIVGFVSTPTWASVQTMMEENVPVAPESMPEGIVEETIEVIETEPETDAEPAEPTGLDVVMDGTSMDTWNASLDEVQEIGGIKERGQVQDAFDYLLMFDIGAKGKPEVLASRLNGMTGREIVSRVKYGMKRVQ